MNLSTISKSLLIALPMLALGACSSNSDSDATSAETNKKAATEEVAETTADNTVETDVIEAVNLSEEEQLVQEYTWAILETTINFDFDKSTIAPRFTKILDAHAKFSKNWRGAQK